ncbi:hypothetical protein MKZ01_11550 [Lysinibacillus endophyticus]|uniref:hypothetical protein n=1 Tax=Ureibacillus endophyticus TaxID=1978490 RepID=UPI003136252A
MNVMDSISDHTTVEETDFSSYEIVTFMYETPETGVFESTTLIDGLEFASIDSLRKEIEEQYSIMVFKGDHNYDEDEIEYGQKIEDLIPREKFHTIIICKEGAFFWNGDEYEYAGQLKNKKVRRIKRIIVPEDKAMMIEGNITVIKAGLYDVLREKSIELNDHKTIENFTIELLNGKIIDITNHRGIFKVYEADIVVIDYTIE